MNNKQLIRQISILERLPAVLLATIGFLFIICSLFAWIWFDGMISLKMALMGVFAVKIGITLENIIILYIKKQLKNEMNNPEKAGKWESRMIELNQDINYACQEEANKEVIQEIIDNICKN